MNVWNATWSVELHISRGLLTKRSLLQLTHSYDLSAGENHVGTIAYNCRIGPTQQVNVGRGFHVQWTDMYLIWSGFQEFKGLSQRPLEKKAKASGEFCATSVSGGVAADLGISRPQRQQSTGPFVARRGPGQQWNAVGDRWHRQQRQ